MDHSQMVRRYPIFGQVDGWYFRQEEVSAGCYIIEGCDVFGRRISRSGVGTPDGAMSECIALAREINETNSH
ncbi:MAG: hypothetical protein JNK85_01725 [Verrucomicrobiales bacterium]|nr:hypothetical protein [Verrucomicrobiales bacterium]